MDGRVENCGWYDDDGSVSRTFRLLTATFVHLPWVIEWVGWLNLRPFERVKRKRRIADETRIFCRRQFHAIRLASVVSSTRNSHKKWRPRTAWSMKSGNDERIKFSPLNTYFPRCPCYTGGGSRVSADARELLLADKLELFWHFKK